jgi:hypothetical protein
MPSPTVEQVFNQARAILRDTQVVGGEDYTDVVLAPYFQEAYRRMYTGLFGAGSKRVQRIWYVNFPYDTTVLIPSVYNVFDLFEPVLVEERMAGSNITIVSTSTTTPISVNAPSHGLSTGNEVLVTDVANTNAPWGLWFITVMDANNFTLNGSASDGVAGSGGYCTVPNNLQFTQVQAIDLAEQGLDGAISNSLQVYIWTGQQFLFRGCTENQQLRITYWASGNPPTSTSAIIGVDNSIDFLAYATAFSAAQASGWTDLSDKLLIQAYGNPQIPGTGLLSELTAGMTKMLQRGPQRRQLPFRARRSKFGSFLLGS